VVIDTSALLCLIRREPEAPTFAHAMRQDTRRLFSVVSLVEAGIVLERQLGAAGSRELETALKELAVTLVPVSIELGHAALLAFWRFGKTIHPAGLNFGDCFVYALARSTGEPLLFKGNDFAQTDIRSAI
jgi:ribonuclease VapC